MSEGLDADRLRPLFEVAPPEFVAARNELVKELKAAKQRDDAAAVGKIRRPSWVDWALNHVAGADPDLVADFAEAASALRDAQAASIEGRAGPDLRGSMASLRGAIASVSRAAAGALRSVDRPPDAAELGARLGDVAANDDAVDQLRAGVLGAAEPGDVDLFAGLTPAPRPRRRPPRVDHDHPSSNGPPTSSENGAREAPSRPALRAVDGGRQRRSATDVGPDRDAERVAAKARARERAPLAKALDAAVRRRSVAADKLEAARQALSEADAAMTEAEADVATASERLAAFDAESP